MRFVFRIITALLMITAFAMSSFVTPGSTLINVQASFKDPANDVETTFASIGSHQPSVQADPFLTGEPGLSARYVNLIGEDGIPYFDGDNYLNFPDGIGNGGEIWLDNPEYEVYLPLIFTNYQQSVPSTWKEFSSPTLETLNAIVMISSTNGWSVGANGTILHWNGVNWSSKSSPTSAKLNGIDMQDEKYGWAVGQGGSIINWNGTSWSIIDSPINIELNDVEIISSNNAWVVGAEGTLLIWDGFQWTNVSSPTTYDLYALDFVSPTDGWAVGGEWNMDIGWYEAVYLHWNGNSWSNYKPVPVLDVLYDVEMITSNFGISVGGNNAKSFWNGTNWNSRYTIPMMHYRAVDLLSDIDGWAVGWIYQENNIQHWNGSNWISVDCPTELQLNDVAMLDSNRGWSVGADGTILRYGP